MTCSAVRCPHCDSAPIVTRGHTHRGTPRDLGQHPACARGVCCVTTATAAVCRRWGHHSSPGVARPGGCALPRGCCASVPPPDGGHVTRAQPRGRGVTRHACAPSPQRTLPCLWSALATPRWTTWGVWWARPRHSGGCGLSWLTARQPSWRLVWAAAQTQCVGGGKRGESR
jgi:hypothetical protein